MLEKRSRIDKPAEIIDTSGFYKNDENQLLFAANFVLHKDFELHRNTADQHTYPTDGWYWFDTEAEARDFLGISNTE